MFAGCTGFNPRREPGALAFEARPAVKIVRSAQSCLVPFARRQKQRVLRELGAPAEPVPVKMELDPGVLAAAVGPVAVKVSAACANSSSDPDAKSDRPPAKARKAANVEVLVLLGVRCAEDEMVMLRPARTPRELFSDITPEQRAEAICAARQKVYSVTSPLLAPGRHRVEFVGAGVWHLDGRPWADWVEQGQPLDVSIVEPPVWMPDAAALNCNIALFDALTVASCKSGVVSNAKLTVQQLTRAAPHAVALRAVSLLRQQYTRVDLPTPALDGGLGADQLAAYSGDWDVYRLLALVSRLVPGALRPLMPPSFAVPNAQLLRLVESWMRLGLSDGEVAGQAVDGSHGSRWQKETWRVALTNANTCLMEHQQAAIERMHSRDRDESPAGHFLVMDTGLGKTVTSLCYALQWLSLHGSNVKLILWITPKGTVENLITQLTAKWGAAVHAVPRVSTAKNPKPGETKQVELKKGYINVIHADHLRTAIDKGLTEAASSCFMIFDEVDEMYATSLRTSAARKICLLSPKFVCQTATPFRNNQAQVRPWLADTCGFPVTVDNLLVAASAVVSIQLALQIEPVESLIEVDMCDEVRDAMRRHGKDRQWVEMARICQQATDAAMVAHAVQLAKQDRASNPRGGVLLVASTAAHAISLIAQCCTAGACAAGFESLEASNAGSFEVVVVPKDRDRGYNSAARLGAMVTGVYAGNAASRHQMRGRLRRLGQSRKSVEFATVVMQHSILHLLHQRHMAVDTINMSLEQLGECFAVDVMRDLMASDDKLVAEGQAGDGMDFDK